MNKKQLVLTSLSLLSGVALGASLAFGAAGSTGGGLIGSKHDMNAYMSIAGIGGTKDIQGRLCAYCHTPHHAEAPSADGKYSPLWSREASMPDTSGYQFYKSQTFNWNDGENAAFATDKLIGPSRLCMGCHDGTVAADAFYGAAGGTADTGDDFFPGGGNGTSKHIAVQGNHSLANDHPIGFDYETARNKKDPNGNSRELYDTTKELRDIPGKSINNLLWHEGTGKKYLTCASCHDVHNGAMVAEKSGTLLPGNTEKSGYFLIGKQKDSSICLTCHDKETGTMYTQGN